MSTYKLLFSLSHRSWKSDSTLLYPMTKPSDPPQSLLTYCRFLHVEVRKIQSCLTISISVNTKEGKPSSQGQCGKINLVQVAGNMDSCLGPNVITQMTLAKSLQVYIVIQPKSETEICWQDTCLIWLSSLILAEMLLILSHMIALQESTAPRLGSSNPLPFKHLLNSQGLDISNFTTC